MVFKMVITGFTLSAISSCTSDQLPPDAVLFIEPENRSFTIVDRRDEEGRCVVNPDLYVDEPLVITLRNAQGSPIGNKPVSVYADYAGNSFVGSQVLALYDDHLGNANGVIDGDNELISGRDDAIAQVVTDDLTGARVLLLRINVSCPYQGDIFAFVDGVVATSDISVSIIGSDS